MLRFFYCCHYCGKPLFQESFVCSSCLFVPQVQTRSEHGLIHQYLFEYDRYSEIFIKNLKYGHFANVIQYFSHRFLPEDATIIALPNSKNLKVEKNHSHVLAKTCFPNATIYEPFEKISDKQARRKKSERREVRLKLIDKIHLTKPVILVDDLLTTGSTIRRAWQMLGKPNAKIITLCYTPKIK